MERERLRAVYAPAVIFALIKRVSPGDAGGGPLRRGGEEDRRKEGRVAEG